MYFRRLSTSFVWFAESAIPLWFMPLARERDVLSFEIQITVWCAPVYVDLQNIN